MTKPIVIAVDGTAASGKGTLAKRLAAHYGFAHLDSGALYRLTALGVIEAGGDPASEADAVRAAQSIDYHRASDPAIRTSEIARKTAIIAALPTVREALLAYQRRFAQHPPDGQPGSVIDGRDIGTIVCPDADVKFYVDAEPQIRAHRRWLELTQFGSELLESEVLCDLLARDTADRLRAIAPLMPAADAIILDTSGLNVSAMLELAVAHVEKVLAG